MTAVLDPTADTRIGEAAPADPPARWQVRAGAFAVDVFVGAGVVATLAPWLLAGPQLGWLWWVFVAATAVVLVAMAANRWLLPTMTGWSLGRALCGIRVVRRDGSAAGLGRLVLRDLAHVLDTAALLVGWLWPLWDRRGRTFADLLARTEVRPVERPQRDMRRFTAKVMVAAVVVGAVTVALSYLVVYREQQALDRAEAQIAEQGPRIVEQMLSFGVDTMDQDFQRAQSLTTDAYRPELVAQQDAVRESGAATNEYWAVSSAVLSATEDKAAMLLAMQGQRGVNVEDLKFITATVRVEFDKVGDQWRVNQLRVLKAPAMQGVPQ